MELRVGTSGYSYKEWKGIFYPARLAAREMLAFYSQHFGTVEINQTFYRLPKREAVEAWAAQVPEHFRFAVKAPRRITHFKRLRGVEEETAYLLDTLQVLGSRFGALLVQLPPDFAVDPDRLAAFLKLIPPQVPVACEFRHASWSDARVLELLREHQAGWVTSDTDDPQPELHTHSPTGYLRLRRDAYSAGDFATWAQRLHSAPWREASVFFKHEREGPARALELARAFANSGG